MRSSASDGAEQERQGEPVQLLAQLGGQALLQLADGGLVDFARPFAAGLVERGGAHLFEQLLDHRPDAHHLGRLLDQVGQGTFVGVTGVPVVHVA